MSILRLSNISRKYHLEENKEKIALDNVSLTFEDKGLVSIVGKSGSGKSTLINMISLMDEPTNGCVYFQNKNLNKFNNKEKEKYRNRDIGIIFQSYHLLESQTVLFNIMLPALIMGKKPKEAEIAAKNLLNSINFKKELYLHKCQDLSGGEKERVAILRSLINNPKIILADEPTGALDSDNSEIVMSLLKQISRDRLVIMVSHNQEIVNKYSDRIIEIKDGKINKIVECQTTLDINKANNEKYKNTAKGKGWIFHLSKSNFLRRFKRNIISLSSLIIGLVSSLIIIGFANGSSSSILNRTYRQIDYGVSTLYKETEQKIPGSKISMVKMSKPSEDELLELENHLDNFYIEPNCDALIPSYPIIKSGEDILEELSYYPIHSYHDESFDDSLIIEGDKPSIDSPYEVIINKTARDYLKKEFNSNPIGLTLSIYTSYEYLYDSEDSKDIISDYFIYEKEVRIVGICDNLDFLSTPKIYYSYISIKDILKNTLLVNLSSFLNEDRTWYDILYESDSSESISSYSYRLFLKKYQDKYQLENIINQIDSPFKIESSTITISNTLLNLVEAATLGMELFLVIALVGTALILGIISFSSYSEDKKTSAILTCLGANKKEIFSIYFYENILICLLAVIISFIIVPLLTVLINLILYKITSFQNMIVIPINTFLNIPFFFPLLIIFSTLLICFICTYVPLLFSKKISPKEELMEE